MSTEFTVDAVLFDMDGTLTDSIAAVEAAWGKVAKDIGQDPAYVIAATHGKRAVDNLSQFKPHIKAHEMDAEVQAFEETILFFADAYNKHGPGSQTNSPWRTASNTPLASGLATPELSMTPGSSAPSSAPSSRHPSISQGRRPSFGTRLDNMLSMSVIDAEAHRFDDPIMEDVHEEMVQQERAGGLSGNKFGKMVETAAAAHELKAWQIEATGVDRSVQILPGVKRMIDSIPAGRYAVATSGAKTYAYGCMTRVGITPPPVTITADDKRLKAGKPAPDPFLLAAECLGFDARKCLVFEDSPSGIRAGVASGATVIAVCTSHERKKIENCGAHYIVENMDKVKCIPTEIDGELKLKFVITA
ncbi:HAD-like protein [Dentipellis sp. KUC8613]|nr:HAD-like protein [Dentipellis sp. KUC8613]